MKKIKKFSQKLPFEKKAAKLLLPRGSYGDDWYDHWGGGGGWWTGSPGSPDNPYELPEVIVTPSGNHVDYSNSDFDYNSNNNYYDRRRE